jgi:predicted permease
MSTLLNDIKYGLRTHRKNPGVTTITVLTLALGITVNAIVFSFANEFFLRPLPARDPGQLVVIAQKAPAIDYQIPFSYPDIVELRRQVEAADAGAQDLARVFAGVMAFRELPVHLSRTGAGTERAWIHAVTDNYFSLLGAQPELGRFLLPGDAKAIGAEPVFVLTYDSWRNRFHADPSIVGQTVKLDGMAFTVAGVARHDFVGASWGTRLAGFVPITTLTQLIGPWALDPGNSTAFMMARLKPEATVGQARAAADVALTRMMKANPQVYLQNTRAVVMPEPLSRPSPYISHHVPAIIAVLMLLSLLVLAVAGANVTNLLYARGASQTHEIAIRSALGASRGRLLRSLLTESVLLALAAGVVGMLASVWVTPAILTLLPPSESTPPPSDTGMDWRPLVFGFVLSLLTGVGAGLLPAFKSSRIALQPLLKQRDAFAEGRRFQIRQLLVVAQVAASCVVLVCAGMALRSIQKMLQAPLGFDSSNLVVASLELSKQRYEPDRGRQFQRNLLEQVRALPGVQAATLVDASPFDTRITNRGGIVPEGRETANRFVDLSVPCAVAEQTALATLRLPVIAGRDFDSRDQFGAPLVAIVNRTLADRFWPGESPIGKRISIQGDVAEVVGLVGEPRYTGVRDSRRPLLIQPLAQNYRGDVTLMVRSPGATAPLVSAIEGIVRRLDPEMPLCKVSTMEQQIAASPSGLLAYRIGGATAAGQGLIALFLAGLGIFGLVSFNVTRRTREIGIRMALGATRLEVLRLITRESLVLVLLGMVVGGALSLAITRHLAGLLYEVSPTDGAVFTVVAGIVCTVTLLAAWLPARRATRVDPMEALRCE